MARGHVLPCLAAGNVPDNVFCDSEVLGDFFAARRWQECLDLSGNRFGDLCVGAASHVLGVRDRLQMIRIHASRVSAQVVQFKAFGDRSIPLFVIPAMRVVRPVVFFEGAVSQSVHGSGPIPTTRIGIDADSPVARGPIVSRGIWNVMAYYPAAAGIALPCKIGALSATTHAQTRRIRRLGGDLNESRLGSAFAASLIDASSVAVRVIRNIEGRERQFTVAGLAETDRLGVHSIDLLGRSLLCRAGSVSALPGISDFPVSIPFFDFDLGPTPTLIQQPQRSPAWRKIVALFQAARAFVAGRVAA